MKTFENVKAILSSRVDVTRISESTTLSELAFDSLDLVEISLEIEDKYHIKFSSSEILDLVTLRDVVKLIEEKTK